MTVLTRLGIGTSPEEADPSQQPRQSGESLIRYAKTLGVKPILLRSDLQNRTPHSDPDLQQLAHDVGGIILANGNLLTPDPMNRHINPIKRVCEQRKLMLTVVPTTQEVVQSLLEELKEQDVGVLDQKKKKNSEVELDDTAAHKMLKDILIDANRRDASDVHFEIRAAETIVKYRILSRLREADRLTQRQGKALVSVAFRVLANESYNFNKIQKGSFEIAAPEGALRLRINQQPEVRGADVVMRFLSNGEEQANPTLQQLGYGKLHQHILMENMRTNSGIILFSGPTGSGKTTTIAAAMELVPDYKKKYTVEDPVEKIIRNTSHIQITADAEDDKSTSLQFDQVKRSILRQDPDVIMLGETRDLSVATLNLELATTGHLVLTTIHTKSALSILTRLHDLGTSWSRLADPGTLRVLVFQRLIGELCPHCRVPSADIKPNHPYVADTRHSFARQRIDAAVAVLVSQNPDAQIFTQNPGGCEECKHEGFTSRTVLTEIVQVDHKLRTFISSGDLVGAAEYLKSVGWESIQDHALHLIRKGIVDPYDADELVGPLGIEDEVVSFDYGVARDRIKQHLEKQDAQQSVQLHDQMHLTAVGE